MVEHQKRDNVHAHIALWTSNRQELSNAEYMDDVVSAEILSTEETPDLYDVVTVHLMHELCGENTMAACMKSVSIAGSAVAGSIFRLNHARKH